MLTQNCLLTVPPESLDRCSLDVEGPGLIIAGIQGSATFWTIEAPGGQCPAGELVVPGIECFIPAGSNGTVIVEAFNKASKAVEAAISLTFMPQ